MQLTWTCGASLTILTVCVVWTLHETDFRLISHRPSFIAMKETQRLYFRLMGFCNCAIESAPSLAILRFSWGNQINKSAYFGLLNWSINSEIEFKICTKAKKNLLTLEILVYRTDQASIKGIHSFYFWLGSLWPKCTARFRLFDCIALIWGSHWLL